jgi:hypothetical protein
MRSEIGKPGENSTSIPQRASISTGRPNGFGRHQSAFRRALARGTDVIPLAGVRKYVFEAPLSMIILSPRWPVHPGSLDVR